MYNNQISDIKEFCKGVKRGTFGLYAATFTEQKMNKFPNGTTPAMRKSTPVNPYLGRVFNISVYQNAATGTDYYSLVKGECEREGIHFTNEEFAAAFPKEETYCAAVEPALKNIILKHNNSEQEYLRLYKGRKPTKVKYYTVCDYSLVPEDSELMADIKRYISPKKDSAKQEALGIKNIVEPRNPKVENVVFLAQGDNVYINPRFGHINMFNFEKVRELFLNE